MSTPSFSLDHLVEWALRGGPAPVQLTEASVERITIAQAHLRTAARSGAVYGLTTGVGALRNVPTDVTPGDGTSHALRLWRSHATGFGELYDDATARAAMAIRLHQITSGRSGVSAGLAASLGAAIAAGAVPELHRSGSIGTGDIVPLAELGLTLVGERPWRAGSAPVAELDEGDALPFMSSNALTLATAALVHRRLTTFSVAAEKVTALSACALQASLQAYDPRVHAGRPDASQQRVAARLMALLSPAEWWPARIQDPFALRTVPQVHAPFVDALVTTSEAVMVEVDDSSENPLVTADGTPLHHGGFVTARLSATLDALRQALYPVISLSSARLSALVDPSLTGLPAFLASGPADSSGVMILEYLAQDALARARILATPVSTGGVSISLGLEEHASFSTQAAWGCEQIVELAPVVVGCELVAAVRALRMDPDRLPAGGPLREVFDAAAALLGEDRSDRPLTDDLAAAVDLVQRGL
ncbi:aromatic amino acid lyase [Nocardioides sp. GXQ0305]|uniref:aromatic amino acid lyase n=1 Tax=Nocardioides sp. GXQ0305 TaxID=3423912 RepID=UPI003D7DAA30